MKPRLVASEDEPMIERLRLLNFDERRELFYRLFTPVRLQQQVNGALDRIANITKLPGRDEQHLKRA
jgi:hypothetical protein